MFVTGDECTFLFPYSERTEEEMEGSKADSAAGETKPNKGARDERAAVSRRRAGEG